MKSSWRTRTCFVCKKCNPRSFMYNYINRICIHRRTTIISYCKAIIPCTIRTKSIRSINYSLLWRCNCIWSTISTFIFNFYCKIITQTNIIFRTAYFVNFYWQMYFYHNSLNRSRTPSRVDSN